MTPPKSVKPAAARRRKTTLTPAAQCWNLSWSPMRTRVLLSGIELSIFPALANGAMTAAQVAKKQKLSLRGTAMLLDELAALGLLKKSRESYSLTNEAELYLLPDSPTYMGGILQHSFHIAQAWENLSEVVRTGKPMMQVDKTEQGAEFFKQLVRGLYASSYVSGHLLMPHLDIRSAGQPYVLDVAAGSAAWSLPFAEKLKARVTVLDLPPVVEVAKEFVERHGLESQYDYLEGDLRKLNFGVDKYDVIILGHIIHSEGAKWSEKLIAKCAKALKRGGLLVIPDMIPNDQRTGPEFPLLFALNMLIHTAEGNTFSVGEYKQWLKGAGLKFEKLLPADVVGTEVVIARK